mmetsp:Transcript_42819/g.56589  ORF Transcript_42819/g.56589 Transcript_42819/m.56589 type:complete len:111 (+) Transcript_42819:840-1172(+)
MDLGQVAMGFCAYLGFVTAVVQKPSLGLRKGPVGSLGTSLAWLGLFIVLATPVVAFQSVVDLSSLPELVQLFLDKALFFGWLMFELFGFSENLLKAMGFFSSGNPLAKPG